MRVFRHSLLLLLAMAMLLPSGLYRDCCCSRRAAMERIQSVKAPIRSCCQARFKRATTNLASKKPRATSLSGPLCCCKAEVRTAAVLRTTPRPTAGVHRTLELNAVCVSHEHGFDLPIAATTLVVPLPQNLGPPEQILLCRWLI